MADILNLAAANILSPPILFFVLGAVAAFARSDLAVPEAVAKGLSIYLLMAIGFKGGAEVSAHPLDLALAGSLLAGIVLSFSLPLIGYMLLRVTSRLSTLDAAAVAAHYGSISIVTFVAATQTLESVGIQFEGFMVAVAAAMEAPAILSALWLASRQLSATSGGAGATGGTRGDLLREVLANGSIVVLAGAFAVGIVTGKEGLARTEPFLVAPFYGALCLFLLDMGLVAGRSFANGRQHLTAPVILFALYMPLISAALAGALSLVLNLSPGGAALLITLAASSSYIAAPAAMRVAIPKANPSLYLTLSLAVTFPFNLSLGIPLYIALASMLHQG